MKKQPIAVQLYSLRELAAKDFVGALELVANLGYEGVEFAGYGGLPAAELKGHLERLNLVPVSTHVSFERLRDEFETEIAFNQQIGNRTLVVPVPPKDFAEKGEDYAQFAREMNKLGQKVAEQGLRLGYHNHSFEFKRFDGAYGLDIFYKEADPSYVFAQLDLGWVLHGGEDPANYLRKFMGRCPLVHIKDFDQNKEQTDVGEGALDLPSVLAVATDVGVEWLILETEVYSTSPTHSVTVGLANLKAAQGR